MNAVMTVDLSELDAWSAQVQRASDDLTGIARNGGNALVQTDFGPILETMMGAYNSLLPVGAPVARGQRHRDARPRRGAARPPPATSR